MASATSRSGRWVVARATRSAAAPPARGDRHAGRASVASSITTSSTPQASRRYSVWPLKPAWPASRITPLCSGRGDQAGGGPRGRRESPRPGSRARSRHWPCRARRARRCPQRHRPDRQLARARRRHGLAGREFEPAQAEAQGGGTLGQQAGSPTATGGRRAALGGQHHGKLGADAGGLAGGQRQHGGRGSPISGRRGGCRRRPGSGSPAARPRAPRWPCAGRAACWACWRPTPSCSMNRSTSRSERLTRLPTRRCCSSRSTISRRISSRTLQRQAVGLQGIGKLLEGHAVALGDGAHLAVELGVIDREPGLAGHLQLDLLDDHALQHLLAQDALRRQARSRAVSWLRAWAMRSSSSLCMIAPWLTTATMRSSDWRSMDWKLWAWPGQRQAAQAQGHPGRLPAWRYVDCAWVVSSHRSSMGSWCDPDQKAVER
jgi:hypothetical protein